MTKFLAFLISISMTVVIHAKTILISDIDDTIKISHIKGNLAGSDSVLKLDRFTGMSEIYQQIIKNDPLIEFFYISAAPKLLMQKRHEAFLKSGAFPKGTLLLRSSGTSQDFKIREIKRILTNFSPQEVILIGDNGEYDPQVYLKIQQQFPWIKIRTFIHLVYNPKINEIELNQTGYAYAAELAYHLSKIDFITPLQSHSLMELVNHKLAIETRAASEKSFPKWLDCNGHKFNYGGSFQLDLTRKYVTDFCS